MSIQRTDACAKAYSEIRGPVEQELAWLQEARQQDPYRDFAKRQLYERVASLEGELVKSYAKRAPSFKIDQLAAPAEKMDIESFEAEPESIATP